MATISSNPEAKDNLGALLLQLERQLMDPVFRNNREQVSALLAEDFREFGSSGRVWTRDTIVNLLATETLPAAPEVEDFAVQKIGQEAALVTYRAIRASGESRVLQATLRSSIWVLRENRWQVLFHQGTKIPDV
jgi:hypothetical protein